MERSLQPKIRGRRQAERGSCHAHCKSSNFSVLSAVFLWHFCRFCFVPERGEEGEREGGREGERERGRKGFPAGLVSCLVSRVLSLLGFMKFLADYRLPLPPPLPFEHLRLMNTSRKPNEKRKVKSEKRKGKLVFLIVCAIYKGGQGAAAEKAWRGLRESRWGGQQSGQKGREVGREEGRGERGIILTVSINQILLNLLKFAYKEWVRDEQVMIKMKDRERERQRERM